MNAEELETVDDLKEFLHAQNLKYRGGKSSGIRDSPEGIEQQLEALEGDVGKIEFFALTPIPNAASLALSIESVTANKITRRLL